MQRKCLKCFKIISVPTRFKIFEFLRTLKKKATVSRLVQLTGLRQPTITFHVNELAAVGLVKKTRVGKNVYCDLQKRCASCPLYVR